MYAADVSAPEHPRSRALLERWRVEHGAWYLTWRNCYEFLRVVMHPRVLRKAWTGPAAGKFLAALQQSPGLSMLLPTDRHAAVLAEVMSEVPMAKPTQFASVGAWTTHLSGKTAKVTMIIDYSLV